MVDGVYFCSYFWLKLISTPAGGIVDMFENKVNGFLSEVFHRNP